MIVTCVGSDLRPLGTDLLCWYGRTNHKKLDDNQRNSLEDKRVQRGQSTLEKHKLWGLTNGIARKIAPRCLIK